MTRILAPAIFAHSLLPASAETFKEAFPDIYQQLDVDIQSQTGALVLQHGDKADVSLPDAFYALNLQARRQRRPLCA